MELIMKKANKFDCELFAKLIKQREEWFISKSNPQWNDISKYYNYEYYLSQIDNLYCFFMDNNFVAGVLLFNNDEFWDDNKNTLYIHSFATSLNYKAIGLNVFSLIKQFAIKNFYNFIRLDCMGSNEKLINIYQNYGFIIKGWHKYKDNTSACLMEYVL